MAVSEASEAVQEDDVRWLLVRTPSNGSANGLIGKCTICLLHASVNTPLITCSLLICISPLTKAWLFNMEPLYNLYNLSAVFCLLANQYSDLQL